MPQTSPWRRQTHEKIGEQMGEKQQEGGGQERRTGVTLKWAGSERPAVIEGEK